MIQFAQTNSLTLGKHDGAVTWQAKAWRRTTVETDGYFLPYCGQSHLHSSNEDSTLKVVGHAFLLYE